MFINRKIAVFGLAVIKSSVSVAAIADVMVGAAAMLPSKDHNTLVAALPAGTVETLLKPDNKGTLTNILTYHEVAGKVDAASLVRP